MLTIKTTGVEDYLDGSANIKMLVIGPPAGGKTRSASFWPKPIYADIEAGRGSLRDRKMPYVEIKTSAQMMSFLAELKRMESTPKGQRAFQTVVIDTLDGFQRKVKDEWLLENKKGTFTGYEAWGYLDSKMQMLLTRCLNLDYNLIINCHFKDKTIKDGENESRELVLQLQGDAKDSVFNDFDLVGFLGTYWEAEGGERKEKRGLTFHRTPDKPFLKDRFGIMPRWMPITFTENDYEQVFNCFLGDLEDLPSSEVVGEIPDAVPEETIPTPGVVGPVGGALPPIDPKDVPLSQYDKPTLKTMAETLGITTTVDGTPIKGNTLKGELIAAIEKHRQEESDASSASPADGEASGLETQKLDNPPAAETPAPATGKPAEAPPAEPAEPQQQQAEQAAPVEGKDGLKPGESVDPDTGEITHEQAIENVEQGLGGVVVSDEQPAENQSATSETTPAPQQAPPTPTTPAAVTDKPEVCEKEGCSKRLVDEIPQYVQLSRIKFNQYLCNEHYLERRRAS